CGRAARRDQAVDQVPAKPAGDHGAIVLDRRLLGEERRRGREDLARRLERGRDDPQDRDHEQDTDEREQQPGAGLAEARPERRAGGGAHDEAFATRRLSTATAMSEANAVMTTSRTDPAEPPAKSNLKNIWR